MSRPVAATMRGRVVRRLLAAVLLAGPALAAPALTENLAWHDNGQARIAWLNPDLVAELRPSAAGRAAMREAHPAASARMNGAVRVWELQPGIGARNVLARLRAIHPEGRYAPVFHDGPSLRNGQRAPTGTLVIVAPPDWNHARVARLAKREHLELVEKLEARTAAWRLQAEDGFGAIESANRLERSGEVRSATPEWWRPRGIPLR